MFRDPNPTYISQAEAAADLGVSMPTIRRMIKSGKYCQPVALPGTRRRPLKREEHEAWKQAQEAARNTSEAASPQILPLARRGAG